MQIFQVLVFQMGAAIFMAVTSPADPMIQLYWLRVDNLTKNMLVGVLGQITFSVGATMFSKYLIDFNWKLIFGSTAVFVVLMNASLTYIVIYDVFRNQYFYLSDEFTQQFFVGVNSICGLVLFIELSETDTEGRILIKVVSGFDCKQIVTIVGVTGVTQKKTTTKGFAVSSVSSSVLFRFKLKKLLVATSGL